jgi:hypothetical protein
VRNVMFKIIPLEALELQITPISVTYKSFLELCVILSVGRARMSCT